MKPALDLETSIIGYLASGRSRDLVTAANQQRTHEWWDNHRSEFDLCISQFVYNECAAGDPSAARERLDCLVGIPKLRATREVMELGKSLLAGVPLPKKAEVDAFHIAIAAVHDMDYLLTWNCTHIANAELSRRIIQICKASGYEAPTICTPLELLKESPDEE